MNVNIETISENHFEELIQLFNEFALFEKLPHKMTNSVAQMIKEKDFFNGFIIKD